jgi:hypothetical protein
MAARQPVAARRTGYLISAALSAVVLYLVNSRPGWEAVSFLTADTVRVLGLVNLSLAAGLVANLLYLGYDGPWLKTPGDLATSVIGLLTAVRVWRVFPFDFSGWSTDWSWVIRVMLVLGIVGSAIAVVVQGLSLLRMLATGGARTGHHAPR